MNLRSIEIAPNTQCQYTESKLFTQFNQVIKNQQVNIYNLPVDSDPEYQQALINAYRLWCEENCYEYEEVALQAKTTYIAKFLYTNTEDLVLKVEDVDIDALRDLDGCIYSMDGIQLVRVTYDRI